MTSPRDKLLRAAVYAAIDAQGSPGYRAALERVVFVHATWPLIEYAHAIEHAQRKLDAQRELEAEAELAWYAAIPQLNLGCSEEVRVA
jgi:hypothetical protein